MPLKDVVKVSRKTFFNPAGWLGYEMLKTQFRLSASTLKTIFTPAQPMRKETFAQAQARFNLSDTDVEKTAANFFIYSIMLIVGGIISFLFSFYLLFAYGEWAGFILGLVTTTLFLTYAFRFSFWRFQIKHRKLGCTFEEWLKGKPNESVPHD